MCSDIMKVNKKVCPPEKLKKRLYPVVLDLFSHNDFHRVNIREISKRTGVSSGTVYKYFASKEDLIFTILNEEISKISTLIASQIEGMVDIKEIIRRVFWVTMNFYDNNPGVAVTAFITVPMRTWMEIPDYKRNDDLSVIKAHITKAQKEKSIDPSLTFRNITDSYYMICYRWIHNWYFSKMEYRLTEKADEYFSLFWKIVKPQ